MKNEDGSYSYIEVGSARDRSGVDIHVQKDFEAFQSVVDGSVVANRRDLAAHNQRNNVVHESEFGTASERESFFRHKADERADFMNSTQKTAYGRELARQRRADIIEAVRRSDAD